MQWLLRSIGIGDELASKLDQVSLAWNRPGVLGVGLALLLPMAALIVWRQRQSLPQLSRVARGALATCRIAVLLLLVIVLSGPYLRLQEQVTTKPVVAVLLDESGSMSLTAGPLAERQATALAKLGLTAGEEAPTKQRAALDKRTRLELAQDIWKQQQASLWDSLRERFEVRTYRIARTAATGDLLAPAPTTPVGETNLGGAMEQVLRDTSGSEVAGIVLLSDGQATTGPDVKQVIAQQSGRRGSGTPTLTPVFTVPIGSDAPPVDVAISDVLTPAQSSVGDTVGVLVTLDSQGLDGREVKLELLGPQDAVLDSAPLKLDGRERQQVQLSFEAKEPGGMLLAVRVSELAEEKVHANNRRTAELRVETARLKLLYLEGGPRWDFRFLDHALRRDHGVEVTLLMQASLEAAKADAAAIAAAGMPQDAAGFDAFDVILLGDVTPALLTARAQQQLAQAVREKGVGLIVQAGPSAMPGAYVSAPLAELLPMKLDSVTAANPQGLEPPAFAPFRMQVTASGALHPAFALYDSATQNRRVWDQMGEFLWSAATGEATPGATVLATYSSPGVSGNAPAPLMAEHFAGRGRVLFIGTDSTFRWRRNIGSHLFYRFWGQAIRHVAKRGQRSGDSSWLAVYPSRTEPGEAVAVELYAVDGQGQPLSETELKVTWNGAGRVDVLPLQRGSQTGHYRGTWRPEVEGAYRITYSDARGKATGAPLEVAASDRELRKPAVDRDALADLAEVSGGQMLELHELDKLATLIQGQARTLVKVHEQEVWDNWLTLVLLVGLYCTDVGLRRMMGLS
jgi:hypothetical protein